MRSIAWPIILGLVGAAPAQETPEFPKPGKEHAFLKQFEGTWDAQCRVLGGDKDDSEFLESRGREIATVGYGDFWLVLDFTGEMHQKSFEGRGTIGYDPVRKKYVLTWFDSLSPRLTTAEGDADPSRKTLTVQARGIDPVSKDPVQQKMVFQIQDPDRHTLTFYMSGAEGKERKAMEIVYTRRK